MAEAMACSEWSRVQHLKPVGSAGHYQGFLLVEVPLPWPPDISGIPELADLAGWAAARGIRLQAIAAGNAAAPADRRPGPARRRVVYYANPWPGWAGPLARREAVLESGPPLEPGPLAEAVASLVEGPGGAGPSGSTGPDRADGPPGPAAPGVVDVLICTHGRRDLCCGSRGTELFGALSGADGQAPPAEGTEGPGRRPPGPEVRWWRTSHTGGHRFAPTALVLPSATLWAYADPVLLHRVVSADGPVGDVIGHYRGCATLGPPAHQALEADVLAQVGWALLASWRRAVDGADGVVQLEALAQGTWEGRVSEGRRVPAPDCRTDPADTFKYSSEWVVEGLRRVPGLAVPAPGRA
jgi:hypothetical protein